MSNIETSSNDVPRNKVCHETEQIYPNSIQPLHVGCFYEQRVVNNKYNCDNDIELQQSDTVFTFLRHPAVPVSGQR